MRIVDCEEWVENIVITAFSSQIQNFKMTSIWLVENTNVPILWIFKQKKLQELNKKINQNLYNDFHDLI